MFLILWLPHTGKSHQLVKLLNKYENILRLQLTVPIPLNFFSQLVQILPTEENFLLFFRQQLKSCTEFMQVKLYHRKVKRLVSD